MTEVIKTHNIVIIKAAPIGSQPISDLTIRFRGEPPVAPCTLVDLEQWFAEEARLLEKELHKTLPGGTYDRLLGLMLARKASHFIIAHGGGAKDVVPS